MSFLPCGPLKTLVSATIFLVFAGANSSLHATDQPAARAKVKLPGLEYGLPPKQSCKPSLVLPLLKEVEVHRPGSGRRNDPDHYENIRRYLVRYAHICLLAKAGGAGQPGRRLAEHRAWLAIREIVNSDVPEEQHRIGQIAAGDIRSGLQKLASQIDNDDLDAGAAWRRLAHIATLVDRKMALHGYNEVAKQYDLNTWDVIAVTTVRTSSPDRKKDVDYLKLWHHFPGPGNRFERAGLHRRLGELKLDQGLTTAAAHLLQDALKLSTTIENTTYEHVTWLHDLATSFSRLATALEDSGEHAKAQRFKKLAVNLARGLDNVEAQGMEEARQRFERRNEERSDLSVP